SPLLPHPTLFRSEKIKPVRKQAASPQLKSDGRPPRILEQIVEMMFPFAELGRFDFDARLLSVQSIDDTKYESGEDSETGIAECECRGRAASDDETSNRNLVWRDSRFAKKRDDCRFDRCVNVSGQVECSILRGIENNTLGQATLLLQCREPKWPHASTHGNDVVIFLRRVDDLDLAIIELVLEFIKKRRVRRKSQENVPRNQCRTTRISD